MRTIDATLKAALATGSFNAYIKGVGTTEFDLTKYKLTATSFEFETEELSTIGSPAQVKLKRGVTINGVNYTLTSSLFYISERQVINYQTSNFHHKVKADLFPKSYTNLAGDDTYQNVITAFCTAFGKTAVFDQPAADVWGFQFLATGKNFTTNNAQTFLNLLRQKYFIFACDNGSEQVLFYQGMADRSGDIQYNIWQENPVNPLDLGANDIITHNKFMVSLKPQNEQRTYVARDESASVRTGGTPGKSIHNLGYLESTDAFPDLSQAVTNSIYETLPMLVNLVPQDGDIVQFDPDIAGVPAWPIEVTEEYDNKKSPSWFITIKQREIFSNTEGGALPSTIERVAAYTPLVTTNFDNNLDETVNNLQALAEAVDDLTLGTPYTDEQAQDAVGAMVSGNTETRITVTYDDATNKLNFVVDIQDASITTYTPSDNTKWTGSADPGDVDDALNQLASRTTTVEASTVDDEADSKKLAFVQLASSKTDIYDPGTSYGKIKAITLYNSNTTDETVTINLHDGTNEYELYKFDLEPLETLILEYPKGLPVNASSKITGLTTTASKVSCLVSGNEKASNWNEKVLAFIQLASSKGDIYDSGSSLGIVHHIILHNTNTSAEVATLYLHDGTNEYALAKAFLEDAPRETTELSFPESGMIVNSSSKITGNSNTAAKVTCLVIGVER